MSDETPAKNDKYGEPWKLFTDADMYVEGEPDVYLGFGTADASEPNILTYEDSPSDFDLERDKRIVACVNACAGLSTEKLKVIEHLDDKKLDQLFDDSTMLFHLQAAGVDNWDGWDHAMESMRIEAEGAS